MQVPGYSRDQKSNNEQKGLNMQINLTTRINYATNLTNDKVNKDLN